MNLFDSIRNLKLKDINFSDVITGCIEHFLTDWNVGDKEQVRKVSIYRIKAHCSKCHMSNNGWCDNSGNRKIINVDTGQEVTGCGCNLKCKTALLSAECPAGLWKSVQPN